MGDPIVGVRAGLSVMLVSAHLAELVDALVLGTSWLPSGSSSLPIRTTQIYKSFRVIVSFSILSSHRPAGIQKYLFKIV